MVTLLVSFVLYGQRSVRGAGQYAGLFLGGDYAGAAPTAYRPYQRTVESRETFSGDPRINM